MGIPGETGEKPGSVTTSPYPLLPQGTSGVYPQTVTPRISSCQNQVSCNNQQWFQITLQHVQDLQLALCPQPCAPELEGILCLLPLSGGRWTSRAWKPQRQETPASPHDSRSVFRGPRPESSSPNKDLLDSWNIKKMTKLKRQVQYISVVHSVV